MKRSALHRRTPLLPGRSFRRQPFKTPVRQSLPTRSKKRAAEERTYLQRRNAWMVEHPFCAACGKPTEDLHHSGGRDGWRLLFEPWWVPLCRRHHDWVGSNPIAAIAAGYSRRRHSINEGEK